MKTLNAYLLFLMISLLLNNRLHAQIDTLPDFSLTNVNGSIQIQWLNPYKNIIQLNIQRSKESNKNFITIHSSPNPSVRFYKYTDKTAPTDSCYYRIFILYEGSNYQFSKVNRPAKGEATTILYTPQEKESPSLPGNNTEIKTTVNINVKEAANPTPNPKLISQNSAEKSVPKTPAISAHHPRNEVQLMLQSSKVNILSATDELLRSTIKPAPILSTKKIWIPSDFIYTGDDGNIVISLPDAAKKNYSLTLLKEEGRPLFRIPKINQTNLTLDKSTFLKSGWYYFELRESGKVVERNKFLITRDN